MFCAISLISPEQMSSQLRCLFCPAPPSSQFKSIKRDLANVATGLDSIESSHKANPSQLESQESSNRTHSGLDSSESRLRQKKMYLLSGSHKNPESVARSISGKLTGESESATISTHAALRADRHDVGLGPGEMDEAQFRAALTADIESRRQSRSAKSDPRNA